MRLDNVQELSELCGECGYQCVELRQLVLVAPPGISEGTQCLFMLSLDRVGET